MAKTKIVEIKLQTTLEGEGKVRDFAKDLLNVKKAIEKVDKGLEKGRKGLKRYRDEVKKVSKELRNLGNISVPRIEGLQTRPETSGNLSSQSTNTDNVRNAAKEQRAIEEGKARAIKALWARQTKELALEQAKRLQSARTSAREILSATKSSAKTDNSTGLSNARNESLEKTRLLAEKTTKEFDKLSQSFARGSISAAQLSAAQTSQAQKYRRELGLISSKLKQVEAAEKQSKSVKRSEENLASAFDADRKKEKARRDLYYTRLAQEFISSQQKQLSEQRKYEGLRLASRTRQQREFISLARETSRLELAIRERGASSAIALTRQRNVREIQLARELRASLNSISRAESSGRISNGDAARQQAHNAYAESLTRLNRQIESSRNRGIRAAERTARFQRDHTEALRENARLIARTARSQAQVASGIAASAAQASTLESANRRILGHVLGIVAGYRAANFLVNKISEGLQNIPKQGIEEQANLASLTGAFGTTQAAEQMAIASAVAEKYGSNLQALERSMRNFAPAALLAGASLQEVNGVFDDFTAVGTVLHKTADQMESVFLALEQMFSKGTVQSEEIKKQLGNQLPAAVEIGAQAVGKTPAEFLSAMRKNESIAKDFVPKFAKLYRAIFAGEGDVVLNSLADNVFSNYQRTLNRYTEFNRSIFAKLEPILNSTLKNISSGIKFITDNLDGLVTGIKFLATALTGRLIVALVSSARTFVVSSLAMQAANRETARSNLIASASFMELSLSAQTAALSQLESAGIISASRASFGRLGTLITGLSVATLSYTGVIAGLAVGLAAASGLTLSYGKDLSFLSQGTDETKSKMEELGQEFLTSSKKVAESIQNLNTEEKTPEVITGITERVGLLGRLSEEYQKSAFNAGLTKEQAKLAADKILDLAGTYAKATREADKLGQADTGNIDTKFKNAARDINLTSASLADLSLKYVNAQKEADSLAGKVRSDEYYTKLKQASQQALATLQKERLESNKFIISLGESQVEFGAFIQASVEIIGSGLKDSILNIGSGISNLASSFYEGTKSLFSNFISGLGQTADATIDIISKLGEYISSTISSAFDFGASAKAGLTGIGVSIGSFISGDSFDESISAGTAAREKATASFAKDKQEIEKSIENIGLGFESGFNEIGNKAAQGKAILNAAGETISSGLSRISSSLEAGAQVFLDKAIDIQAAEDVKKEANLINTYMQKFTNDLENHASNIEKIGSKAFLSNLSSRTKADLAFIKFQYEQNLLSIEEYYTRKKALEDKVFAERISDLERQKAQEERLSLGEGNTTGHITKAKDLELSISQLQADRSAKSIDNLRQEQAAQDKFSLSVLKSEAQYLSLIGKQEESVRLLETMRNLESDRVVRENLTGLDQGILDKQILYNNYIQQNRIEQGKLADVTREVGVNQTNLSNIQGQIAARESSYNLSIVEGIFAKTRANEEYLRIQREILANAEAGYNPEADKNHEIADSIEGMRINLQNFELTADEVGNSIKGNLTDGLTSSFKDFITGAKSAGEAMKDFALSILDSIAQIAANQLASSLIGGLFSSFGGGLGGGGIISGAAGASQNAIGALFGKETTTQPGLLPQTSPTSVEITDPVKLEPRKQPILIPPIPAQETSNNAVTSSFNIENLVVNVQEKEGSSAQEQSASISGAIKQEITSLMQQQIQSATRPGAILNPTKVSSVF